MDRRRDRGARDDARHTGDRSGRLRRRAERRLPRHLRSGTRRRVVRLRQSEPGEHDGRPRLRQLHPGATELPHGSADHVRAWGAPPGVVGHVPRGQSADTDLGVAGRPRVGGRQSSERAVMRRLVRPDLLGGSLESGRPLRRQRAGHRRRLVLARGRSQHRRDARAREPRVGAARSQGGAGPAGRTGSGGCGRRAGSAGTARTTRAGRRVRAERARLGRRPPLRAQRGPCGCAIRASRAAASSSSSTSARSSIPCRPSCARRGAVGSPPRGRRALASGTWSMSAREIDSAAR
jgi:hypothetical protein